MSENRMIGILDEQMRVGQVIGGGRQSEDHDAFGGVSLQQLRIYQINGDIVTLLEGCRNTSVHQ